MGNTIPDAPESGGRPEAALTPRPIRLLLVGRVRPGKERVVREAQARFPTAAAAEAGIDAIEAFIGSGFYAVAFEFHGDEIQESLAACLNDARMRAFLSSLDSAVEGLPGENWIFGPSDTFHGTAPVESDASQGSVQRSNTGDWPLAASMYRWSAGHAPRTGKKPTGSGTL
jgi:hypothetical protein